MQYWGMTDRGKVRSQNQDSFFAGVITNPKGEEALLCLICDGMGGANAGDVASALARDSFTAYVTEHFRLRKDPGPVLRAGTEEANRVVMEKASECEELYGMGTTLVAMLVTGEKVLIANVGDSRCYLIRGEEIRQITKDHSLVQDMIEKGELTREQARRHPRKNVITRAIGTEDRAECDLFPLTLQEGDRLLLCSDGLSNVLDPREMLFEVLYGETEDTAAQRMMEIALERNAPDNVTVVLLSNAGKEESNG